MTAFTRLGSSIWDWKPWISLDEKPRLLWLALYTSTEAKRLPPGLFHGSYTVMSEAARMSVNDTMIAIDQMLDREEPLVEYDQTSRVLRLTMLPDAGEYPSNADIISSWWRKFLSLPECEVRDAHVPTLRWILDRGAQIAKRGGRNRTGKPMHTHEERWDETFATVTPVPPRRRGIGRLADSDTSTSIQPGLFRVVDTVSPASREPSSYPASGSAVEHEKSGICHRVAHGGERERREGEGVSSFLPELRSGEHGPGQVPNRPVLSLVPGAITPAQLLAAIACGVPADVPEARTEASAALCRTIDALEQSGVGLADVAMARPWAKMGWERVRGDPDLRIATWAATPGLLLDAVEQARKHEFAAAEKLAMAADARRALGITTT